MRNMAITIPPWVLNAKRQRITVERKGLMNPTIDSQDLRAFLDLAVPPRVLDVRTAGEFDTVHIPGAYNVPLDLLREHRDEIIKHLRHGHAVVASALQPGRHL
jgi:hypothetical protein